jgi:hypothetical protein
MRLDDLTGQAYSTVHINVHLYSITDHKITDADLAKLMICVAAFYTSHRALCQQTVAAK